MKWQSIQENSLVRVEDNFILNQGRNETRQVNNGAILAKTLTIIGVRRDNRTSNKIPQTNGQHDVLRAKRKGTSWHNAQALILSQERKTERGKEGIAIWYP